MDWCEAVSRVVHGERRGCCGSCHEDSALGYGTLCEMGPYKVCCRSTRLPWGLTPEEMRRVEELLATPPTS